MPSFILVLSIFSRQQSPQYHGLQPLESMACTCDLCTGRTHILTKWYYYTATLGQNVRRTFGDADISYYI